MPRIRSCRRRTGAVKPPRSTPSARTAGRCSTRPATATRSTCGRRGFPRSASCCSTGRCRRRWARRSRSCSACRCRIRRWPGCCCTGPKGSSSATRAGTGSIWPRAWSSRTGSCAPGAPGPAGTWPRRSCPRRSFPPICGRFARRAWSSRRTRRSSPDCSASRPRTIWSAGSRRWPGAGSGWGGPGRNRPACACAASARRSCRWCAIWRSGSGRCAMPASSVRRRSATCWRSGIRRRRWPPRWRSAAPGSC